MKNLDYPQNLVEVVLGHPNTEISKIELVAGVAFVLESLNTHMSDLVRLKYSNQYSKSQLSIAMFMPESELDRLEELAINKLREPERKIYFEKGIVARLGEAKFTEEFKQGFVYGYLQQAKDSNHEVFHPLSRIVLDDPILDLSVDIDMLGLSEEPKSWLRSIGRNTIKECLSLSFGTLSEFDDIEEKGFSEIAKKINEYGVHFSDWDVFL